MSAIAEALPQQAIAAECKSTETEHMLALVQGDVVISTFPEDQTDAAIDLARVLCRALTQPVDLFRVRRSDTERVQAGATAHTAEPAWTQVAHLHSTFPRGVDVEMHYPGMREKVANQHLTL